MQAYGVPKRHLARERFGDEEQREQKQPVRRQLLALVEGSSARQQSQRVDLLRRLERSLGDTTSDATCVIADRVGPRPYDRRMAKRMSRRARASRRRQRRMNRADNDLTDGQWTALLAAWGGCAYCGATGTALQRDCVLALSRGGRYTLTNVVPACRSCNTSKCNHEVTGWLRRKRLDERAFLLRHHEVSTELASPA